MLKHAKHVLAAVESTVKHPVNSLTKHPLKTAAVAVGAFLLVDHLISAPGHSYAQKAIGKVVSGGKHAAAGSFGPGWGRGNMPYLNGGHYAQTPADVSRAHMGWNAAAGGPQQYYSQSSYPWA